MAIAFKSLAMLAALGTLLAGCVSTGSDDGLERMQRNQRNALESAG
jgi:hypothetical protein